MSRLHCFTILIVAVMAAGCASKERVELASYDFVEASEDPLYGVRYGQDTGVHTFGDGWSQPGGEGMWTLGRDGGCVHLHVLGSNAKLTLLVSTSPLLANTGQQLKVLFNGREVAASPLRDKWRVETVDVDVPDDLLIQGVNELRLVPSHLLTDIDHPDIPDDRPLGVFLRALFLDAELDAKQLRRWKQLTDVPPVSPSWATLQLPPTSGRPPDVATLPDVLVVALDAARVDHFGCYGYPRDTTPNIDGIAAEGVRLENVVAEASYTRCSVAGLLTGTSWRQHHVVGEKDALSPQAITWAEIMASAGYQTLGVSDNPNVSHGSGLDQGFDDFIEVWKHDRKGPETAVDLFADEAARLSDAPAFVYVHLLPPHTPYFPGDFDLWKPEGYQGDVSGSYRSVNEFDRGQRTVPGADYDRLVSLYDGGLRRADALVGRLLDIWRGLHRSRETLLVILSDHGEAFGEHGRFGHNFTVYDEMVRVPVILYPASAFAHLRGSTTNLRALSDVLPIVLQRAGVPLPAQSSWPRHFLSVLEDPTVGRNHVFIRSSERMVGVRDPTTLTVFELWTRHEFYDLQDDPGATTNLRVSRADDYLRGVRLLRGFLENTDSAWAAAEATMSKEDVENLKALGYL